MPVLAISVTSSDLICLKTPIKPLFCNTADNGMPLMPTIENVTNPKPDDIIIDVRHPDDAEQSPLSITGNLIVPLPFSNLSKSTDQLDKQQSYLLYCDKGIMSRLHADALSKQGFIKVGVFTTHSN
jgi:thiazole biosynthesis-like protein